MIVYIFVLHLLGMACRLVAKEPVFFYYIITNDNDMRPRRLGKKDNFSIMDELFFDWLVFARRDQNWVGHVLMKRPSYESIR